MVRSTPVVAADGGVRQAGVTGEVDAVSVRVQLGGTAAAAGVGDVPRQRRHDAVQQRGAVERRVQGRLPVLEVKGEDLDPELHGACRRRGRVASLAGLPQAPARFPCRLCPAHRCTVGTAGCPGPAPRWLRSERALAGGTPAPWGVWGPGPGQNSRGWSEVRGGQRSDRPSPGGCGSPRPLLEDVDVDCRVCLWTCRYFHTPYLCFA